MSSVGRNSDSEQKRHNAHRQQNSRNPRATQPICQYREHFTHLSIVSGRLTAALCSSLSNCPYTEDIGVRLVSLPRIAIIFSGRNGYSRRAEGTPALRA